MSTHRNIYLVGPMGSGKTAVGKQLARLLGVPFVDSDTEIERRTGADIPLIFEKEGEAGFREREREVIAELTQRRGVVLSTGGGAILKEENRRQLQAGGVVVYLETSIAQQAARVRDGENRPMLNGQDTTQRLTELMAHRAPLYREVAALTVRTDGRRVRDVAEEILREVDRILPP
ncbi:MAG: shikimate kinase AroK [Gammaproteobacteria bacterium]|jgi:shikimate kinase|nr:shikimate kinase AroK [Gammaproteobacteria bacterium]